MPGFIYFIPTDKQALTAADFEAAGLGYALTGDGVDCRPTTAGPDGRAGVLAVANAPGAAKPKHDPAGQVWRKGPTKAAGPAFYVGMNKGARPGPADLVRPHAYGGTAVRLLDGQDWTVPRCHAVLDDRPPTLPRVLDVADDGESVVLRPHPAFEQLGRDALRFWLDWSGQSEDGGRMTPSEQVRLAVAALAVNYRVGLLEAVALLRLWGTDEFGLVLRALIDADEVEAHLQKKASAGADD